MSDSNSVSLSKCHARLTHAMQKDQYRLRKRLHGLKKITDDNKRAKALTRIAEELERSCALRALRAAKTLDLNYPAELPVVGKKDDIKAAIAKHQLVVIAGETGSGKTTQIPKICLELGRGVAGMIGHTQPRRLAARSVSNRIAEELSCEQGKEVGFKIRFGDHTSEHTLVKLMTDGVLLAEMQQDRFLNQYDTIIIDEAHERSLNIDFLLGYLKQLLPKRPDLKVIITSATIDPQRFSKHFNDAPVIEVSGRTYPVEVRYRPGLEQEDKDRDQLQGLFDAVEELYREPPGDILVFLNGEREIRDTADALQKLNLPHTEILPLYSRLSAGEQNRVFQSHPGRRIVLATNVAETSLTVPGIRYVIDPGTARISRYSYRSKVQQLPIEAISQASANQRKGRCGRVAAGICIRLYSEEDFLARPEFTDPEILRTNLASVILQMLSLRLGSIDDFPFLQRPDSRFVNDGIKLLEELSAVDIKRRHGQLQMTPLGQQLARLPIDPRLARMLLEAPKQQAVQEVLVIVAALSIQDPRERPLEKQQKADELHSRFADQDSDFVSYLKLWQYLQQQQDELSQNQFRKLCKTELLNYLRVREWQDLYYQLQQLMQELGFTVNQQVADYASIHRSLLAGLLGQIGSKDADADYLGPRQTRFYAFPGSHLFKRKPKWVMASEWVETSKLYARTLAKIEPEWIEPLAGHLVSRSYSEPHWQKKRGAVIAFEQVSLYGVIVVAKRPVQFSKIDVATSHQIFIREALVHEQLGLNEAFLAHNRLLLDEVIALEDKSRRRDILVDEEDLVAFYAEKVPLDANNRNDFAKWWKLQRKVDKQFLNFDPEQLRKRDADLDAGRFPEIWRQGNLKLPLEYHFAPGEVDDGVSVLLPLALLNQIDDVGFDWLIPGLLHELLVALIKSLPKQYRRQFVPAPNYADALLQALVPGQGKLLDAITNQLRRMSGSTIPDDAWDLSSIPPHLTMNFKVTDAKGKVLKQGRSLALLKQQLQGDVQQTLSEVAEPDIEQQQITEWSFGHLPAEYVQLQAGYEIKAYPALVDDKDSVSIKLLDHAEQARQTTLLGLRRLVLLNIPSPVKYLQDSLPNKAKLGLYFNPFGKVMELIDDCIAAAVDAMLTEQPLPTNQSEFLAIKERVRAELGEQVLAIALKVEQILSQAHAIQKRLKGKVDLAHVQAQAEVKQHLEQLLFKGFVSQHGAKRLDDILRYVKAMEKRLEKLPIDPHRDRLMMHEYQRAEEAWQQLKGQYQTAAVVPQPVADIRWMIEELKVSLFAQTLGTAYPISLKRVLHAIAELK
ncbi:ATP-dependent RNA helicase HrpA [Alkalimonas collagenimarina]|uniref:ATP-dependent RNA helicase HrpA n=1 Tax=Alkalimonas collagenimarina TaxID=400390 RepID=A0ABT9H0E8_9GAMM|nr:ATP-dependent RNA helicase HrpA [Alkalimonas collagenimarina]MDP4536791.1 ATP-dependent RNA helicase HrpA [Alkalimonas collagenimarina]